VFFYEKRSEGIRGKKGKKREKRITFGDYDGDP